MIDEKEKRIALPFADDINVASKWKPIETAPKDGSWFLIAYKDHVSMAHWDKRGICGTDGPISMPTHWMPCPELPGAAKEAGQAKHRPAVAAPDAACTVSAADQPVELGTIRATFMKMASVCRALEVAKSHHDEKNQSSAEAMFNVSLSLLEEVPQASRVDGLEGLNRMVAAPKRESSTPEYNYWQDVFKGADCFEKWAANGAFWEKQAYGNRFYFGDGAFDYITRGHVEAAVKQLEQAKPKNTQIEDQRGKP